MKRWVHISISASLLLGVVRAQFAEGQPVLHAAIGPAFSYMISFNLDETAFSALKNFSSDFDLSDPNNDKAINGNGMVVTGFEGFGEVSPHWTIGMYAGQGEYLASATDAADVQYLVNFVLSAVGVTAEFNTHSRSRLKLLGGSMFGIGQASLSASSSPGTETWDDVIAGTNPRRAFELSAWTPVIQPYLGARFDISRTMGFKTIAGWNEQVASATSWKLYHDKGVGNSQEVPFRALFFRVQIYVIL